MMFAQKKEISQAKAYLKSGKDYDKAEKLMVELLKDDDNHGNEKIYDIWLKAIMGQYAQANEKIYLKQKYDTAAMYNIIQRMYMVAETLDSLDVKPDEKGKVKLEYREDNAEALHKLRRNLYYGGTYNMRKGKYKDAFRFFDTYIDADRQPLFSGYDYMKRDTMMPRAAYWATVCGHRSNDPEMVLKYSRLALQDTRVSQYTLQYMCDAFYKQENEKSYEETLREGFRRYPDYPYFFPRLADLYNSRMQSDSVLLVADVALKQFPDKPLFLLAKSVALLHLGRNDDCIAVSQKLISLDAKLPEPHFNIATIYLNEALELEKKNEPRLYHDQLQELYKKARPHMETYRMLAPKDKNRWAPALYRIYLNLNLGSQFEEIDRLLKK
jgi:hypothetical protein